MSLGKIYYDPKHTAGFSSAAKLVSEAKIREMSKSGCQVKTRTFCISLYAKDFLEIHILLQILTMFGKLILRT